VLSIAEGRKRKTFCSNSATLQYYVLQLYPVFNNTSY